jgi:hypothetical protein
VAFSEPVRGVDAATFTLEDARGRRVPASVGQIGDGVFGLFPDAILLEPGATYTAALARVCDLAGNCTARDVRWSFKITADPEQGAGDTTIPGGFTLPGRDALSQQAPRHPSKKGRPWSSHRRS